MNSKWKYRLNRFDTACIGQLVQRSYIKYSSCACILSNGNTNYRATLNSYSTICIWTASSKNENYLTQQMSLYTTKKQIMYRIQCVDGQRSVSPRPIIMFTTSPWFQSIPSMSRIKGVHLCTDAFYDQNTCWEWVVQHSCGQVYYLWTSLLSLQM